MVRDGTDDLSLEAAQALFRFARMFGRPVRQVLSASDARGTELSRVLVVQAIDTLESAQATVGAVAQQLDVDPSTASRLVAETVREGYAMRKPSQEDGRRSVLELTDSGRQLAEAARTYQQSVFERATRRWTPQERETFARLFVTFMQAVADLRDEAGVAERVRQP